MRLTSQWARRARARDFVPPESGLAGGRAEAPASQVRVAGRPASEAARRPPISGWKWSHSAGCWRSDLIWSA